MDRSDRRGGWRISEVEALLGLGRRDIQRACYNGRGGVAILDPTDTTWGRRSYDARDLAQLFMVRQYRRQGLSLPEIKAVFDESRAEGRTVESMLTIQVDRLRERAEEVLGQLLQAEALLATLDGAADIPIEEVVARHGRALAALDPDGAVEESERGAMPWLTRLLGDGDLIDAPGMALAVDLWLGPGSSTALREVAEQGQHRGETQRDETIGDGHGNDR